LRARPARRAAAQASTARHAAQPEGAPGISRRSGIQSYPSGTGLNGDRTHPVTDHVVQISRDAQTFTEHELAALCRASFAAQVQHQPG
jgi:hypothetical protein